MIEDKDDVPAAEITNEFLEKIQTGGQLPNENDDDDEDDESNKEEDEEEKEEPKKKEIDFIEKLGLKVGDLVHKRENTSYVKMIVTAKTKKLNNIPNDNKKCHCGSKKKYKNCCFFEDVEGYYESETTEFFCDMDIFKKRILEMENDEEIEVKGITKLLKVISI